jgi:hypothetical protein
MPYTQLLKATNGKNKYTMIFYDHLRKKVKTIHFGAKGYEDYTSHQDLQRKMSYIARHEAREDWSNPQTAGTLSKFLLWNRTTLSASYKDFRNKFKYELY